MQFGSYLSHIAQGDFGNSLVSGRSVNSMLSAAVPVTLQLGLTAITLLAIVGIALGVVAALNQRTRRSTTRSSVSRCSSGASRTVFVAGPLIIVLMVLLHGDVPFRLERDSSIPVVPLLVLGLNPMGHLIIRQARTACSEVLSEDYVHARRQSQALPARIVVFRHIPAPGTDAGRQSARPDRDRHAEQFHPDREGVRTARTGSPDRIGAIRTPTTR